jgi:ankyrin repeat protein
MTERSQKGLRPLSFLVLGLALAQAASSQVLPPWRVDGLASRDVNVWSEHAQPDVPAASNDPVDDAEFAAIAAGGPWTAADWQPLRGPLVAVFAHARADRWADVMGELKAQDLPPDVRDRDGATLLTMASRRGQADVVRELLRRGADADRRGLNGFTPLCAAAVGGHDLVVQDLLRAGASPGRWSAQGQGPLHLAAREGQVRVMRSLVAAGARPQAWNRGGHHALAEAASTGHIGAMAALVDMGVSPDTLDQHGLNAMHAAALNRHFEAVDWLRQRGVAVPHPLTQVLIDRPADPLPVLP